MGTCLIEHSPQVHAVQCNAHAYCLAGSVLLCSTRGAHAVAVTSAITVAQRLHCSDPSNGDRQRVQSKRHGQSAVWKAILAAFWYKKRRCMACASTLKHLQAKGSSESMLHCPHLYYFCKMLGQHPMLWHSCLTAIAMISEGAATRMLTTEPFPTPIHIPSLIVNLPSADQISHGKEWGTSMMLSNLVFKLCTIYI